MNIKILSWNIWEGKHLKEIVDFLKKSKPDIIGLQEVVEKEVNGKKVNTAKEIAREIGYKVSYFRALTDEYDQGNAILSRYPIVKQEGIFLSKPEEYLGHAETEPRIAVKIEIKINGVKLNIITVHLAYSDRFQASEMRGKQIDNLLKILPKERTILMGDFNSLPENREIGKIEEVLVNADKNKIKQPTWTVYPFKHGDFETDKLEYRLDNIFVSKDIEVDNFRVGNSMGSDHLPIMATISILS